MIYDFWLFLLWQDPVGILIASSFHLLLGLEFVQPSKEDQRLNCHKYHQSICIYICISIFICCLVWNYLVSFQSWWIMCNVLSHCVCYWGTFFEATTYDKVAYLQDFQGCLGFEALIEFTLDQKEAGDSILNENLYSHPLHQQVWRQKPRFNKHCIRGNWQLIWSKTKSI